MMVERYSEDNHNVWQRSNPGVWNHTVHQCSRRCCNRHPTHDPTYHKIYFKPVGHSRAGMMQEFWADVL